MVYATLWDGITCHCKFLFFQAFRGTANSTEGSMSLCICACAHVNMCTFVCKCACYMQSHYTFSCFIQDVLINATLSWFDTVLKVRPEKRALKIER